MNDEALGEEIWKHHHSDAPDRTQFSFKTGPMFNIGGMKQPLAAQVRFFSMTIVDGGLRLYGTLRGGNIFF